MPDPVLPLPPPALPEAPEPETVVLACGCTFQRGISMKADLKGFYGAEGEAAAVRIFNAEFMKHTAGHCATAIKELKVESRTHPRNERVMLFLVGDGTVLYPEGIFTS